MFFSEWFLIALIFLLGWILSAYLAKTRVKKQVMADLESFCRTKQWDPTFSGKDKLDVVGKTLKGMTQRITLLTKMGRGLRWEKRTILEALDEGVVTLDGKGRITYCNINARKMLQLGQTIVVGRSLMLSGNPFLIRCQHMVDECCSKSEVIKSRMQVEEPKKICIDLTIFPTYEGSTVLLLKDLLGQQRVLDMGREFIANASHELRTPVTIIKGFAETLIDLPKISDVMFESILEKILRNSERMEALVKNLLLLADLESNVPTRKREFDLVILVENASQLLIAAHPHAQVEVLHNRDFVMMMGDPDLFELALTNLLSNAVKYSKDDPMINVTIKQEGEMISLDIADQGIGIPHDDQIHIFDRFYTVNKAHSRKLGGAGLGLSIVKMIVDRHEGNIYCTSNPEGGVTFKMVFPLLQTIT